MTSTAAFKNEATPNAKCVHIQTAMSHCNVHNTYCCLILSQGSCYGVHMQTAISHLLLVGAVSTSNAAGPPGAEADAAGSGARRGVSSPWLFLLVPVVSTEGLKGVRGGLFVACLVPDRQKALTLRNRRVDVADANALRHASRLYPASALLLHQNGACPGCAIGIQQQGGHSLTAFQHSHFVSLGVALTWSGYDT